MLGEAFKRETETFRAAYRHLRRLFMTRDPKAQAKAEELIVIYRRAAESLMTLANVRDQQGDSAGAATMVEWALANCRRGLTIVHLLRGYRTQLEGPVTVDIDRLESEWRRRKRPDPLQALRFRNLIDDGHLAAAERIRELAESIARYAQASTSSGEARLGSANNDRVAKDIGQVELLRPWFSQLTTAEQILVRAVLIEWRSIDTARVGVRMGWDTAARVLAAALMKFALTGRQQRA